ncbi:hypothetical protein ZIOFF_020793 [Zingiber officinale]|uniref:J domain-containing protein n=1 Tax=Zingiber officinale TaxID=94328 RepID=A0A8J5HAJ3_ZINOF|nr:hypothetical protein ZIOFF_020793 [Zingiber officinale]
MFWVIFLSISKYSFGLILLSLLLQHNSMAKKGYQQRDGLNCNAPDHKAVISDSVREKSEMQNGMAAETDHLNADNVCHSSSPGAKTNKTKANGKKNRQPSGHALTRDKSDDENPSLPQLMDKSGNLHDLRRSKPSSDVSEKVGTDGTFSDIFDELPVGNNNATFIVVASRNLRYLTLYVFTASTHWLAGQKPWLKAINSVMCKILLLSMVWLDCSIRGLDSPLRLGTTPVLTTVWCSILCFTAMIGFMKMLIITCTASWLLHILWHSLATHLGLTCYSLDFVCFLALIQRMLIILYEQVIATALVIFIGIGLTILIMTAFVSGILWFYGSFWVTVFVSILSGVTSILRHDRIALLITTIYSMHCARCYLGWFGVFFSLNASFISSDFLIHFLKNNINDYKSGNPSEETRQNQSRAGFFMGESSPSSHGSDAFHSASNMPPDCGLGFPSTSGTEELTSEDEVARLLKCTDHYSALGFMCYENVDVTQLKIEYRKKAMLVHPDKNMGNDKAAEAFKKLQNGYEINLNPKPDGARIAKSSTKPKKAMGESNNLPNLLLGLLRNVSATHSPFASLSHCHVDPPRAYVCANSKIYEVTDWFVCQCFLAYIIDCFTTKMISQLKPFGSKPTSPLRARALRPTAAMAPPRTAVQRGKKKRKSKTG